MQTVWWLWTKLCYVIAMFVCSFRAFSWCVCAVFQEGLSTVYDVLACQSRHHSLWNGHWTHNKRTSLLFTVWTLNAVTPPKRGTTTNVHFFIIDNVKKHRCWPDWQAKAILICHLFPSFADLLFTPFLDCHSSLLYTGSTFKKAELFAMQCSVESCTLYKVC